MLSTEGHHTQFAPRFDRLESCFSAQRAKSKCQRSQSVFDNIFHGMQIDAPSTGQGRKREHVTSSTLVHDIHDMNGHDIKWK